MALTKIKTQSINDNAITNAKMADDAIDSADLADGSIDNVHLAGSIAVSKTLLSAGTGLTLSTNTLNVDAAQTQITSVGTLSSLNTSGNIGLGVTPDTWHSSYDALQGANFSLSTDATAGASKAVTLAYNQYIDSGNAWTYINADEASYYQQYNGAHYFATAGAGSADGDVTNSTKLTIANDGAATFAGSIKGANGSASSPEFTFTNNADSGMYSPADNQLAFASGGTQALIFGGDQTATFASTISMTANHASNANGGLHLKSTADHNWYIHPNSDGNLALNYNNSTTGILLDASGAVTFGGGQITMTNSSDMILNLISTATNGKEYEIQSTDAGNLTFVRRTGSAAEILRFSGSDDSATFAGNIVLPVGGDISPADSSNGQIDIFGGGGNKGGYIKLRGGGNSGDITMYTGTSGDGTAALTIDSSQNATFAGNQKITKHLGIGVDYHNDTTLQIENSDSSDNSYIIDAKHTATNANGFGVRFSTVATGAGRNILQLKSGASGSEVERHVFRSDGSAKITGDLTLEGNVWGSNVAADIFGFTGLDTSDGMANVQGSGGYGMGGGKQSCTASAGAENIGKSHWGGISCVGFSGSGVQGMDIVAWGYGGSGATVLKSGNWIGSLSRTYSTSTYHLTMDVGTDCTVWTILIGV